VVDASFITILGKQLGWQDDMVARNKKTQHRRAAADWKACMVKKHRPKAGALVVGIGHVATKQRTNHHA
jgi:hypothetical protein